MLNLEDQIFKQIEKSNNILIIFKEDGDGDFLASALGLFLFLKNSNKSVEIVKSNNENIERDKKSLSFLPSYEKINNKIENIRRFIVSLNIENAKISQIKYSLEKDQLNFIISPASGWFENKDVSTRAGEFKYDLIITVGVSDLESLANLYDENVEFFYKTTIINIDNRASNEDFGQINLINLNVPTVSEIIFNLLKNNDEKKISEDVATCLLAGIIKKTKNFQVGNLTPKTFLAGSELINFKARREEIIQELFHSKSLDCLKLWGEILNNLRSENNNKLLWSKINYKDLNSTGKNSLDEIVEDLISGLPETDIFVVLTEKNKEETVVFVYSLKTFDVLNALKDFNPQGNKKMLELLIKKPIKDVEKIIIYEVLLNKSHNDIN